MKTQQLYVEHILACIGRIERFCEPGIAALKHDDKTRDAILYNLHVLAESTAKLDEAKKSLHPEIEWRKIIGFRNVIVHDYWDISLETVWAVIQYELPKIKSAVAAMHESAT